MSIFGEKQQINETGTFAVTLYSPGCPISVISHLHGAVGWVLMELGLAEHPGSPGNTSLALGIPSLAGPSLHSSPVHPTPHLLPEPCSCCFTATKSNPGSGEGELGQAGPQPVWTGPCWALPSPPAPEQEADLWHQTSGRFVAPRFWQICGTKL